MDAIAVTRAGAGRRIASLSGSASLSAWVLSAALILYLGFNGGGYAFSTYGQVGIVVWWITVVSAAWGLLPVRAPTLGARVLLLSFGAFTVWTALGITWSISVGRSFADLALITSYLGILVLAISIHRERHEAVRHTVAATATAITILCAVAVATRLWPGLIPSARDVQDAGSRLSWPLDYWNALAALSAVGLPLLLSLTVSARRLIFQGLSAAAVPVVVLCAALTQSRGGVLAAAVAVTVWIALSPERAPKLLSAAVIGGGSALLCIETLADAGVRLGQTGPSEHHQAATVLLAGLLICAGVGTVQAGIGRAVRHAAPPRWLAPSRRLSAAMFVGTATTAVLGAVLAGAPHLLNRLWQGFKNPVNTSAGSHLLATSGEGRYQYWVAGINSAAAHPFTGSGPGTFQLDWLPRAHLHGGSVYVVNAHNLYVETYTELGLIGLGLLLLFILTALVLCVRVAITSPPATRAHVAGITAAVTAFFIAAGFDWFWQIPVLVAIVIVLIGATVAPAAPPLRRSAESSPPRRRVGARRLTGLMLTVVGVACLVAIAYPLSANTALADSQHAVDVADLPAALTDAREAVRIEPRSGAAQLQLALVLEADRDLPMALRVARRAVSADAQNWVNWLTLSRLEAENGHARAAVLAYERARALNPESPLFAHS